MGILSVLIAAGAAYAFGAIWYMKLAAPWMEAAGIKADENGRPKGGSNATPYIISLVSVIIVAGMTRHIFALSGIDGAIKGLVSGLGLGLFIAAPWIASNYGFAGRPVKLTLIDGGYATIGCAIMGLVLGVF